MMASAHSNSCDQAARKRAIHAMRESRQAERRAEKRYLNTGVPVFRLFFTGTREERRTCTQNAKSQQAGPSTTFARGCRRRGR
jgi:hypothetical protein